jgi:glycoprotein-N-acetylgalactosamine 3-beta-galactosyltransferase
VAHAPPPTNLFLRARFARRYSDEIRAAGEGGEPLFLGRRFKEGGKEDKIFNSGGAGYVLNRRALELLNGQFEGDKCMPHLKAFWEDVMVARCLKNEGVHAYDTRDGQGAERFHPFTPGHHLHYAAPKKNPESDWYIKYTIDLKFGMDCCSEESLSFHYVKPDLMQKLYRFVYGLCSDP